MDLKKKEGQYLSYGISNRQKIIMEKIVNIYLYKAGKNENFGEYLFKKIVNELGYDYDDYSVINPPYKNLDYILTGIGGNFNGNIYSKFFKDKIKKWHVWGSGVIKNNPSGVHRLSEEVLKNKCVIAMLRGPLTKEFHNIKDNILFGDPGYLASYFFKFTGEHKKNVFVQFYADKVRKEVKGVDINLSSMLLPDDSGSFDFSFFNILKNISNANIVLTGSMHIAIAAHSYGVPWAVVPKEKVDISKEWKWHDTLATINIKPEEFKLCNNVDEGFQWWDSIKDKIKPITKEYQKQIIKAFPFYEEMS